MNNEEVVENSDKAVTECTKVVSATHSVIKSPEKNMDTSHKGNPKNPATPPQLKPKKTFDTVVTSPSKYNNSSAMVVPSPPQQRYRPYDLTQQRRTVNFLSQMEARSMIPIQVRRENPPTVATLMEWASSLQLGDGKTKPLDLKLKLRLF
ncbi:hypothetical protein LR48_Vigan03g224400 [Vigna angularis]|uniref:Uncharacterized protein n=1 Tax=Phaseolus angularis TaxID=3914 RepID=A0A0L9U871_PHAAN|nr:uncharacterized protein HKW66_Vig0049880 [Vigna angularis]KOM38862.1 hypothetical protein LR48_Vigan03g224400 [Vigna angularis]